MSIYSDDMLKISSDTIFFQGDIFGVSSKGFVMTGQMYVEYSTTISFNFNSQKCYN